MEEPNWLIRWTIFVFAGGDAGIVGALSLAAIGILSRIPVNRRIRPTFFVLVFLIGLALVVCGSLATPIWFDLFTIVWLLFEIASRRFSQVRGPTSASPATSNLSRRRRFLLIVPACAWLTTLIAIELPTHFTHPPRDPVSTIMVIGDSVTAGLNDGEDTWPRQLSRVANVQVLDASQPGATLRSARQQNRNFQDAAGTVVLEIGGNDLLEGLPIGRFRSDMNQLLTDIVRPDRSVIMFELPLPPLCVAYGVVQRQLAAKHHVTLIPKRAFANALTTKGATVDGIHLSLTGQSQMKELVQRFFGSRIESGRGTYQHFERKTNMGG